MKERPILFSGAMVRAILAGRKTQTRRALKRQPGRGWGLEYWERGTPEDARPLVLLSRPSAFDGEFNDSIVCPYGAPGERLWVRESGWERPERTARMMREGADTWAPYYYDADPWGVQDHEDFKTWGFKRRPSIFMPRWASRITLEVTGVRVERLHAITEADAQAEGIYKPAGSQFWHSGHGLCGATPQEAYSNLWKLINGDASWALNPWVWVVEFARVQ